MEDYHNYMVEYDKQNEKTLTYKDLKVMDVNNFNFYEVYIREDFTKTLLKSRLVVGLPCCHNKVLICDKSKTFMTFCDESPFGKEYYKDLEKEKTYLEKIKSIITPLDRDENWLENSKYSEDGKVLIPKPREI